MVGDRSALKWRDEIESKMAAARKINNPSRDGSIAIMQTDCSGFVMLVAHDTTLATPTGNGINPQNNIGATDLSLLYGIYSRTIAASPGNKKRRL